MTLYVREYEWMWNDLRLSLAECRVYAYIYGLTHGGKGGYSGSKRGLAKALGLSAGTVKLVLDTLMEKHLIVYTGSLWKSVQSSNTESIQPLNENVQSLNESVQPSNSPHTPLYNNKIKEKQADMTFFDVFWDYFNPDPEFNNRKAATQMLFESRSGTARQAMVNHLEALRYEGKEPSTKNPYFFVQDFPEPQPQWLRGDEGGDIVQVKYNGAFKLCSRDTMEQFGLQWVRDW